MTSQSSQLPLTAAATTVVALLQAALHSPHVSKNNKLASWTREHHFIILLHIDKAPSQPPLAVAVGAATVDSSASTKKSLGASLGLMRHGSEKVPSPAMSLTGVKAVDFYLECMLKGGTIPGNLSTPGDKLRAKLAFNLFNAFAKPEERRLLLPPPAGAAAQAGIEADRKRLGHMFEGLVFAHLSRCYTDNGLDLPKTFTPSKQLLVGSIETRLDDVKKKGFTPLPADPDEFAQFRSKFEAASTAKSEVPGLQVPGQIKEKRKAAAENEATETEQRGASPTPTSPKKKKTSTT